MCRMAKLHARPSLQYRYEHYDPRTPDPWRVSSYCAGGECVEVGGWRVARTCESGACVEVGHGDSVVAVRDKALAESPVLAFPAGAWDRFISSLK